MKYTFRQYNYYSAILTFYIKIGFEMVMVVIATIGWGRIINSCHG